MPKYETIQVDMNVQGEEEQRVFTEALQALKDKLQKTGNALTRTLNDVKKGATSSLSAVAKLFKTISGGQSTKAANKALRRTVASFDELNRLVRQANATAEKNYSFTDNEQVVTSASQVIEKVKEMGSQVHDQIIEPLSQLPALGLEQGFQNLGNSILSLLGLFRDHNGLIHTVGGEWDKLNLKTDFWRNTIEQTRQSTGLFNSMLEQTGFRANTTGQVLNLLGINANGTAGTFGQLGIQANGTTGILGQLGIQANGATGILGQLGIQSNGTTGTIGQLGSQASGTTGILGQLGMKAGAIAGTFNQLGGSASTGWSAVNQAWSGAAGWFNSAVTGPLGTAFANVFSSIKTGSKNTSTEVKNSFTGLGTNFSTEFSNAWKKVSGSFSPGGSVYTAVEGGVLTGFKTAVNSLITGVNTVTAVPFNGLNKVLDKVQNIKIGLLKPFSFLSWRASVPKIPFLAQGAVLPANKPFLAMVGDQRHGTNVEAPLSTIQEAVVLAMEDYMQGNLAGHAATVDLLQQLVSAVQGISIGDETIAAACHRHNSKMAIVNGR